MSLDLNADKEFWELPLAERQGRCGAGEGLGEKIVPDYILNLCVTPACSIHDFDFEVGETHEDFQKANRRFHNNLYRMISYKGGWLRYARYPIATTYYAFVSSPLGAMAFWNNKNKPETLGV